MALGNNYLAASLSITSAKSIKKYAGLLIGLLLGGGSQSFAQAHYDEPWSLGFGAPA